MATSGAKQKETLADPKATQYPLFFKKPIVLDSKKHADAGLSDKADFAFAADARAIPITMHEVVDVAKHYPIVFSPDMPAPLLLAVVSLKDSNLFLDKKNKWEPYSYMPVYVRKYPFIIMRDEKQDRYILCVDEDAKMYQETKADRKLFDGEKPTKMSEQALMMCGEFQKQMDATRAFCEGLAEKGLLAAKEMELRLTGAEDEQPVRMAGFQLLEESKITDMDEASLVEWHRRGWLPLLTLIMASQRNWQYLSERQRDRDKA